VIRKSFSGTTKVVDDSQGLVEAIVNTTGIEDLQSDVMEPGCWDELCKSMSLGETDYPSVLWGHDWAIPVGKVLHAEELYPGDARLKAAKAKKGVGALRIIAQYNRETQRGREAYSDVKNGIIKQWSVGFMPAEGGHRHEKGLHFISKVGIWPEVSNVLIGASPGTYTAVAKSAEEVLGDPNISRVEKALAIEQIYLKDLDVPTLTGPEAAHNEPLQAALTAIKKLIAQELAEDEGEFDCINQLSSIALQLQQWAVGEAQEYTSMSATKPTEKEADETPLQPEAAQPAAEASLTLQQHAEWLLQYVTDKLNVPTPQHSDPEPTEDLSMPAWARQNIRPST
jgi:HK97 family phage prohead protease